jgi:D-3-phosphoglycerate dehydrogenase
MHVIAYDPYVDEAVARAAGVRKVELAELLAEADVVSLHVLLTDETRHLIGERELAAMKPEALLVNSARGPVVDEVALAAALRANEIAAAVVDVFELEPPVEGNPLLELGNCHLTPHLAGCTDYGYAEIGELAADLVARFAAGEELPAHCVV